ncbi:UBP-type zinc finger domain-containing protein [Streptomyces sp. NPDC048330]|uniref:UBP-type zinc finger domain-containing protein n=1 Tax=Streptomyces sp. NPDC048330 TaxID=3365533 RepID=UPI00371C29D5
MSDDVPRGPETPHARIPEPTGEAWSVAPDGGRPEGSVCTHVTTISRPQDAPASPVCAECAALGRNWVRLRWCTACGHIGCCDSSGGRHAHAHHVETGHPVVVSLAADESWAWCYVDEVFLIEL